MLDWGGGRGIVRRLCWRTDICAGRNPDFSPFPSPPPSPSPLPLARLLSPSPGLPGPAMRGVFLCFNLNQPMLYRVPRVFPRGHPGPGIESLGFRV
jgi:hypothetical protein